MTTVTASGGQGGRHAVSAWDTGVGSEDTLLIMAWCGWQTANGVAGASDAPSAHYGAGGGRWWW